MPHRSFVFVWALAFLVGTTSVVAAEPSEEELAKKSQNPVANMISVPFENNTYFDLGPNDKTANILNLKPVIPATFGKVNLISRFILPVIYLEGRDDVVLDRGQADLGFAEVFPGTGSQFGLGNMTYQGFLSPAEPGPVIYGLGPALVLPTHTDDSLGSDTWSAGVSALVLGMPGKWVIGALAQNVWSFAKSGGEADVNSLLFQPIVNYNIAHGWYLSSVPVITANWEANSSNRWTVPVGGGLGRVFKLGNQPLDVKLSGYYNVERPRFGARWNLQFTLKFLFPK